MSMDFSVIAAAERQAEIARLCDAMDEADKAGRYPQLTVERPWSVHNPVLRGGVLVAWRDPLVPGARAGQARGGRRPDLR